MSWVRTAQADVFAVLDGMGGHAGGAIAAELAVQVLQQHFATLASPDSADAVLRDALRDANETIHAQAQSGDPATLHMGTTAVVLVASGPRVMLAHVGDSRAYLMKRNGELRALTKDHSRVQKMVDAGVLTQLQAASHPEANVLERALGHAAQVAVDVSKWLRVRDGESCMLCSDGLHGYVSAADIAAVLQSARTAQEHADELVKLALERGGEDNVTVQVIRYDDRRRLRSGNGLGAFVRKASVVLVPLLCVAVMVLGWFAWVASESTKPLPKAAPAAKNDTLANELRSQRDEANTRYLATQRDLQDIRAHLAQLDAKLSHAPSASATSATSGALAAGAASAGAPPVGRKAPPAKTKPDARKPPAHRGASGSQSAAADRASVPANGASAAPPAHDPADAH